MKFIYIVFWNEFFFLLLNDFLSLKQYFIIFHFLVLNFLSSRIKIQMYAMYALLASAFDA